MGIENTHGGNWFGVTWSLAIEEQAYLLLPFVVRFLPDRLLPFLLLALAISAPVIRACYIVDGTFPLGSYVWPHCRWDAIAIGSLTAWIVRQLSFQSFCEKLQRRAILVLLIFLLGVVALTLTNQGIGSLAMGIVGHSWLALGSAAFILSAINPPPIFKSILNNTFLTWMGTVSYGVYLLHQPVAGIIHGFIRGNAPGISTWPDLSVSVLALCTTLLLSGVSWTLFESKLVEAARRLSYGRPQTPAI
jgi:peptidoglycan/LPS O-acetylase OafA/YrhL